MARFNDYSGQVLDNRYVVERLLGKGGMGAVYLGRHNVIGRRVAIKFLHTELSDNEDAVTRFYREAQIAASIGHRNIIDVLDVGVSTDNEPYIVMEYLEGESLSGLLSRTGTLSLGAACAIVEPVLLALQAAHELGIVHRDLKPDNIFLAYEKGGTPVVKLIDFGISKVRTTGGGAALTQTGAFLGTPSYMAPEQIRGDRDLDHRADIYAMGVVLYQMLCGGLPFSGANANELVINVLTTAPMHPSQVNPQFPIEAEGLVLKCMAQRAEHRPQTALAFLDELRALRGYNNRIEQLSQYTSGPFNLSFAAGDLGPSSSAPQRSASEVLAALQKTPPPASQSQPLSPLPPGMPPPPPPVTTPATAFMPPEYLPQTKSPETGSGKMMKLILVGAALIVLLAIGAVALWLLNNSDNSDKPPTLPVPPAVAARNAALENAPPAPLSTVTPTGAGGASEKTVAQSATLRANLWAQGNRWVYRSVRESTTDQPNESAFHDYYVAREVTASVESGEHQIVTIVQQGGIVPEKNVHYDVTAACVHRAKEETTPLWCEQGATETTVATMNRNIPVRSYTYDDMTVFFNEEIGIVKWILQQPDEKRIVTNTLVGYRVGTTTDGEFDRAPPTCAWQRTESFKNHSGTPDVLADGSPEAMLVDREKLNAENTLLLRMNRAGRKGWSGLILATDTSRSAFAFLDTSGSIRWSSSFEGQGKWLKGFGDPDTGEELVGVGVERDGEYALMLFRRQNDSVSTVQMVTDFDDNVKYDAFLMADLSGCYLRLIQKQKRGNECVDVALDWSNESVRWIRGSLAFRNE